ncbi:MAG: cytochrome c oxidase subunit II [Hyphomonas sp.]|uniref:cytochrome c oxidase subunit II n=1 Tax=Hyphomonas sp. TaxID=87 RepID=UPI0034A0516A
MRYLTAALSASLFAAPAFAAVPVDGAIDFQPAATRIAERVHEFHVVLLWIITLITALVTVLLIWVMVRYNKRANKTPRKFSHNTTVEVVWTVVPALILVGIASLSFPNLYYQNVTPNLGEIAATSKKLLAENKTAQHLAYTKNHFPDAAEKGFVNIKVQGNQWNWTYTYPDIVDDTGAALEFVSNGLYKGRASDPTDVGPRLLATDYPLVVPAGRYIRYYTAAADVIHAFAVPAFAVKTDAVPGRLNEGWFLVEQEGVYYGQCSELCGIEHAFMPIEVRVVSQAVFDRWAELMKAGDYDAAAASVRQVAALGSETKFASSN